MQVWRDNTPPIAEAFSIINPKKDMNSKLLKLSYFLKQSKNLTEALELARIIKSAGLHDTYWINKEGKKTTLIDLLDATENIKAEKISIGWLKPHLLDWNNEKEEMEKIEKADLRYPILIFVDNKGEFISIIDGHHRAQKAVMHGMKSIDGKIIPIDSLPADIREVFNFW